MTVSYLDGREAAYERGPLIRETAEYQVYRATELSCGAAVVLHRFPTPGGLSDSAKHSAIATLKRYAMLRGPRLPRLVDAWIAPDHLAFVEHKQFGTAVSERNNPFRLSGRQRADVYEETLHLMVGLAKCNIIHGRLEASSFLIATDGKVYLDDSGVDGAVLKCLKASGADTYGLAQSLAGFDIAQWAYTIIGLQTGEPLIASSLGERWDAFEFEQAEKKLRMIFSKDASQEFFLRCLRGFTGTAPMYDSATDAQKAWQILQLRSLIA
jgi:hypothetical protein